MVGFRNAVAGTAVTNWWDNGNNAIAFGRGSKGYVAINHEGGALTRTFHTSLPAGTYCDVEHGATASGGCTAEFTATIGDGDRRPLHRGPGDAIALYVGAPRRHFRRHHRSRGGSLLRGERDHRPGQNIYVVGDNATLGAWNTGQALLLSSASYPVWKLDVALAAGTSFQYKYIRKDASGSVTWESGANRTATVPPRGKVALNDTWRN